MTLRLRQAIVQGRELLWWVLHGLVWWSWSGCLNPFTSGRFVMEVERVIIASERFMMMESCVRIRVDSYWMTPLDCYKREVRNGMVPHVLDYEWEVCRGWTMSDRFVEASESLRPWLNGCSSYIGYETSGHYPKCFYKKKGLSILGESYLTSLTYVSFILAHSFYLCLAMIVWFVTQEQMMFQVMQLTYRAGVA